MHRKEKRAGNNGFSLIELMIVLTIFVLGVAIAVPAYRNAVDRSRSSKAISDIQLISTAIGSYRLRNGDTLPASLAEIDREWNNPWGNPYQYINIAYNELKGDDKVTVRKNKNLKPLNTDFDLFSKGPDGDFQWALTAPTSKDDIIRAHDGAFVGVVEDY